MVKPFVNGSDIKNKIKQAGNGGNWILYRQNGEQIAGNEEEKEVNQ